MASSGYNQFCPVAKACEILEPRWTLLILCEMWSGSSRFNEIRRGVPTMSPTLLSKRLKEMEIRGLIVRAENNKTGNIDYHTTVIANKLEPIVHSLGQWAHQNLDADVTLENLDSRLLMWNVRRKINLACFPPKRTVVHFIFPDQSENKANYWLIARVGCEVDLCVNDPGFDVDLFVHSDLKTMTSVFLGFMSLNVAIETEKINLTGDRALASSINEWLLLSSFAPV